MCLEVFYENMGKNIITHFAQPNAKLPVKTNIQATKLISWGRRIEESGHLPLGGWASLDAIKQGKWEAYFPRSVKIMVDKFMEQDIEGRSMWFDVTHGHWLQGLLIQRELEVRVYIVTLTPELPNDNYPRWPRILLG